MNGPRKLKEVRRTDTTLTLITEQDDATVEFNCGLGDTFYYGLQLVSVGNSVNSEPLTYISLSCRDEFGTSYHYTVETDEPDKFLPLIQKFRQYPVLESIYYGDDHITVEFIRVDGKPDMLTIGTVGNHHEYTLTALVAAVAHGDCTSFPLRSYELVDRTGQKLVFQMLVPADKLKRFVADQYAYFQALEEQYSPKHEAADFPNVLQQAA